MLDKYLDRFKKLIAPTHANFNAFMNVATVATIYFCFTGTWQEWLIVLALYTYKVVVLGSAYMHRYLAHRSYVAPKWFEYMCGVSTLLGGGTTTALAWTALHREHHIFSDRPGDPYSPVEQGFWAIQMASKPNKVQLKYVPDLAKSKFYTHIHHYFWLYSFLYALVVFLIDPRAILYAYFVPSFFSGQAGRTTSSVTHLYGYKNFKNKDNSKNNIFVGYFVGGEGWHNNHHYAPGNPKFGIKWWEFDSGWWVVRLVRLDKDGKRNTPKR